MTLGNIVLILLLIPVSLHILASVYSYEFNIKYKIFSGKPIPETLSGKLFVFIRKHFNNIIRISVIAMMCLLTYGIGALLGQWATKTFVGEYEATIEVCNKHNGLSALASEHLLAAPMELSLIRCKYRNERMFGLFDLFVSDDIYKLPEKIIKNRGES